MIFFLTYGASYFMEYLMNLEYFFKSCAEHFHRQSGWLSGGPCRHNLSLVVAMLNHDSTILFRYFILTGNNADVVYIIVNMSSGFISGGSLETPVERDDEWKQAQKELDAERARKAKIEADRGGKSLFEVLQANKGDFSNLLNALWRLSLTI